MPMVACINDITHYACLSLELHADETKYLYQLVYSIKAQLETDLVGDTMKGCQPKMLDVDMRICTTRLTEPLRADDGNAASLV